MNQLAVAKKVHCIHIFIVFIQILFLVTYSFTNSGTRWFMNLPSLIFFSDCLNVFNDLSLIFQISISEKYRMSKHRVIRSVLTLRTHIMWCYDLTRFKWRRFDVGSLCRDSTGPKFQWHWAIFLLLSIELSVLLDPITPWTGLYIPRQLSHGMALTDQSPIDHPVIWSDRSLAVYVFGD